MLPTNELKEKEITFKGCSLLVSPQQGSKNSSSPTIQHSMTPHSHQTVLLRRRWLVLNNSCFLHSLSHAVWTVCIIALSLCLSAFPIAWLGEEPSQHYTDSQTPTAGYPFHTSRTTQIRPHPRRGGGQSPPPLRERERELRKPCACVCLCKWKCVWQKKGGEGGCVPSPASVRSLRLTSTFNWT